jgi:uncharacterized protein (TIGR02145 family)
MKQTRTPSLALAALGFAGLTFLVACSESATNPGTEPGNPSSSSTPSSSSYGIKYGESVEYGNETYKTVVIGEQTWFAENLNYDPYPNNALGTDDGSWCNGTTGEGLATENLENCKIYGRLYDWATVMGFPAECKEKEVVEGECIGYSIETPHQGICPEGWHVPTNAEWSALWSKVSADGKFANSLWSELEYASGGWNYDDYSYTPNDEYGFSALPGGYWDGSGFWWDDSGFYLTGYTGYWWSSSEIGTSNAFSRDMNYSYERLFSNYSNKSNGFSVRCAKD